jgi:Kef-type K+ transport system membrane component KefB
VSVSGILLPFSLGFALGGVMHGRLGLGGNWINFSLFLATAMSITAIPTLGRMMLELNLTRTRIGAVTISAAAVDDVVGWIIPALVTAIACATFHSARTTWMIASVFAYVLIV